MYLKKKISALVLIAVIACGAAGCKGNSNDPDDSYKTDRYIPTVEDATAKLNEDDKEIVTNKVDWAGPDGYTIVVPKGNADLLEVAHTLSGWFKANANVDLKIVTDDKAATDKEIIIGKTKRYDFTAKEGEYFAKVENGKLVFGGGHNVTVKKAVETYTRLSYEKGKAHTYSGSSDFASNKFGYTYVWGDEFDGAKLNKKLWGQSTKMAATAEMALDNTELTTKTENGYLKMTALRYYDAKKAGVQYVAPWSVTTMDTMSYKYGYVEIRAKLPFIRGVWPSFWTSSSGALGPKGTYDYSIEVDIFEVFSSLDKLSPNIHKWYANGDHTMWAIDEGNSNEWYQFDSDNLVEEYHIYGFEWTKTKMVMYIDDKPYYTYDLTKNFDNGASGMGGYDTQLYLIFNNHLFTASSSYKPYSGCEVNAKDLPAEYAIDWVRLYQKNDGISKLYTAQ